MCASKKNASWLKTPLIYTLMIILGVYSGMSNLAFLHSFGLFIGEVFIKIFKCISLPIIFLSIIVTLASFKNDGILNKIWRKTIFYTLGTTLIAAFVSCLLYLVINPSLVTNPGTFTHFSNNNFNYLTHLSNLIPQSLIAPFLEQQVLSVLFLGLLIGIAIGFIPESEHRETITSFFKGLHSLFMVLTKWIIAIIPLGLYGFITTSVLSLRAGSSFKGIGEYLLIIVLANLIQGLIILPMWLKSQGLKPYNILKGMMPALSLAFFSKSSVGTLPLTIQAVEKNLNVEPHVGRFVLPLCTSINMNGCAAFIFVTVIYLMQNHGVEISLFTMLLWVVVATIAAIGNAGVPMGCFFLSASLLASMNIPITLLGIILPFYSLIDMLETSLNVWSDACVTKIIDEKLKQNKLELEPVSDAL